MNDYTKLLWVTNHPKNIKGMWPRRAGCTYIEGPPRGNVFFTSEQLTEKKLVGVYVDMERESYYNLPLVKNIKELKAHEQ